HRNELDRLAEALDGGQVAKAVLRAEIGDLEHLLQGPRAGHDLAEDGADGGVVERPLVLLVGRHDVLVDLFLAGRGEDVLALFELGPADLAGNGGPLVDQLDDLYVQFVDLGAEPLQLRRRTGHGRGVGWWVAALGFAGHVRSLPLWLLRVDS